MTRWRISYRQASSFRKGTTRTPTTVTCFRARGWFSCSFPTRRITLSNLCCLTQWAGLPKHPAPPGRPWGNFTTPVFSSPCPSKKDARGQLLLLMDAADLFTARALTEEQIQQALKILPKRRPVTTRRWKGGAGGASGLSRAGHEHRPGTVCRGTNLTLSREGRRPRTGRKSTLPLQDSPPIWKRPPTCVPTMARCGLSGGGHVAVRPCRPRQERSQDVAGGRPPPSKNRSRRLSIAPRRSCSRSGLEKNAT